MAPIALIVELESDYEPDIELPDFRELGKTLRNLSCLDHEEYNPEDFVDDKALLKASGWIEDEDQWERLPLEPIGKSISSVVRGENVDSSMKIPMMIVPSSRSKHRRRQFQRVESLSLV